MRKAYDDNLNIVEIGNLSEEQVERELINNPYKSIAFPGSHISIHDVGSGDMSFSYSGPKIPAGWHLKSASSLKGLFDDMESDPSCIHPRTGKEFLSKWIFFWQSDEVPEKE